jgi:AraC-like DNA-binding protein
MAAIVALLDSRAALGAVRRSLPPGPAQLLLCRSPRELERALQSRLIEAILLGTRAAGRFDLPALRSRYPGIPIAIFGPLRAEDAPSLLHWETLPVALLLVEGVDDPVAGDLLLRHTVSRRRLAGLAEFPRLLRLTERLQLRAWERLAGSSGRPPRTGVLARSLGVSREHLSRQFGAGGAPNLKRVADLLAVQAALELLSNPGYPVGTVAQLLDFASPSHLRAVVRRVTGVALEQARGMGPRELVRRFLKRTAGG